MFSYSVFVFLSVTIVLATTAVTVPQTWKICKKSDPKINECLKSSLQDIIRSLKSGNSNFDLPPLEPLLIEEIVLHQGNGQAVTLDLTLKKLNIYGLSKVVIDKVDAQLDKNMLTANLHVEGDFKIISDYTSKGKILLLPINGAGKSELILDNFKAKIVMKFKKVTKGDETFYSNEKNDISIDTTRLHLNFKRTVNADDPIAKNLNVFLNENWKEILNELKPAISQAFGAAIKNFANKVFSKVPLNKLLPA
ncbi:hypothetical protein O3M35_002107 [Rhynocoris fuscipes]|uniref:Uncharacterized protein n=1 Tax=Rhynocoris fuscipes TaxID=488301 RepID=A0AAW1CTX2_9HEMI